MKSYNHYPPSSFQIPGSGRAHGGLTIWHSRQGTKWYWALPPRCVCVGSLPRALSQESTWGKVVRQGVFPPRRLSQAEQARLLTEERSFRSVATALTHHRHHPSSNSCLPELGLLITGPSPLGFLQKQELLFHWSFIPTTQPEKWELDHWMDWPMVKTWRPTS